MRYIATRGYLCYWDLTVTSIDTVCKLTLSSSSTTATSLHHPPWRQKATLAISDGGRKCVQSRVSSGTHWFADYTILLGSAISCSNASPLCYSPMLRTTPFYPHQSNLSWQNILSLNTTRTIWIDVKRTQRSLIQYERCGTGSRV